MPLPQGGPLGATTILLLAAATLPARAGMPSLTLTDLAEARLQTLSFFLILFLASALAIQALWNSLRRDFARLPRLTYPRALAVTGLWGLLFILVLTMISGARELMTPGAWDKNGLTYKLNSDRNPDASRAVWTQVLADRKTRLIELKANLWSYASAHDGQFPPDDQPPGIPATAWETSDPSRIRYLYFPGHKTAPSDGPDPPIVACEPSVFASRRLALFADGQIREMNPVDLARLTTHPPATAPSAQAGGAKR